MKVNIFRSATLKLSAVYTLILILISVLFSVVVYNIAQERFVRRAEPPAGLVQRVPIENRDAFREALENQATEDRSILLRRLILFNIAVVGTGALLSYQLARKTLEPINEAHQAQRKFAADAAHELRTPLSSIILENQVLLRDKKSTKQEYADQIQSNIDEARKLSELTDGLLQLASLEGAIDIREEMSLNNILESLADDYDNISLTLQSTKNIYGNYELLNRAFRELVENSNKHNATEVKIQIELNEYHKGLEIIFQDNGQGIKPTDAEHIFQRLYKSSKSNGHGLGLSLVADIIELHGGNIRIDKTYTGGARFIINL